MFAVYYVLKHFFNACIMSFRRMASLAQSELGEQPIRRNSRNQPVTGENLRQQAIDFLQNTLCNSSSSSSAQQLPTVEGEQSDEQITAAQRLFGPEGTVTTDTIDTPVVHPNIAQKELDLELLRDRDNFVVPDGLGLIECIICAYGVFNETTQNSAMGHFMAVYYKQYGLINGPQMFNYMSILWNRDVRTEFPHVPAVTPSAVMFHFENCMRTQNVEQRLHQQLERIERVQDVLESNGLFVECQDFEDTDEGDNSSSSAGNEDGLTDDAREFIVSLDRKISAIQKFMEQRDDPDAATSSSTVARTGLSVETQGRMCHTMDEMTAHLAKIAKTRQKSRKRKRVQVAIAEGHLFDKYCARAAQAAKVLLEWKKYNSTIDMTTRGLPSYCSGKKSQAGNLTDIYTGKKSTGDSRGGVATADAAGTGEMAGRFAAY